MAEPLTLQVDLKLTTKVGQHIPQNASPGSRSLTSPFLVMTKPWNSRDTSSPARDAHLPTSAFGRALLSDTVTFEQYLGTFSDRAFVSTRLLPSCPQSPHFEPENAGLSPFSRLILYPSIMISSACLGPTLHRAPILTPDMTIASNPMHTSFPMMVSPLKVVPRSLFPNLCQTF